jgi:hypothetical protein
MIRSIRNVVSRTTRLAVYGFSVEWFFPFSSMDGQCTGDESLAEAAVLEKSDHFTELVHGDPPPGPAVRADLEEPPTGVASVFFLITGMQVRRKEAT